VLGFILWNKAVRAVGANRAAQFVHLMPVISIVLAVLFLGEKLMIYHVKGVILAFVGIALTTLKIKSKA